MPDPVSAAKGALKTANAKFPSSMAKSAGVTPAPARTPKPAVAAPTAKPIAMGPMTSENRGQIRQQNVQAASDFAKSQGVNTVGTLGVMHKGGTVPETGKYLLEKGEQVVPKDSTSAPADKTQGVAPAPAGRQSEYRKVYQARRAKRGDGGNAPVSGSGERPEAKKASDGQANGPKAGAHVKSE